MSRFDLLEPHQVKWGITGCSLPECPRDAELLWDGYCYCLECADRLLERIAACEMSPGLQELLTPLDGSE